MTDFNKAASSAYHSITSVEKEALRLQCTEHINILSVKAIKSEGVKIFQEMQKLVILCPCTYV